MQKQLTLSLPAERPVIDYEEACRAIDMAREVEEVKVIRDQSLAIEEYAQQAPEDRRKCAKIRVRAERKIGALLVKQPKAKGGGNSRNRDRSYDTTGPKSLEDMGIDKTQSSQWQKLAMIKEEFFEDALVNGKQPVSTAGILKVWNKVLREEKRREREERDAAKSETLAAPAIAITTEEPDELEEFFDNISLDQWKTLTAKDHKRLLSLDLTRNEVGRFNSQTSGSIEWAQWSWNPVTGCLHNCPYCYARDLAESARLASAYPNGFTPTFRPSSLLVPRFMSVPQEADGDTRYRNVFTCSMADLFGRWVPAQWIEAVLDEMASASQWNFLCLTKFPKRMAEFDIPKNCWMGTTVDLQARVAAAETAFANVKAGVRWLSIEPLLQPIKFSSLESFDWMVIGGSTSSTQTPEWIPPISWVIDLVNDARAAGVKVYMKTNLGVAKRILELPFDAPIPDEEGPAPSVFNYLGKKG